MKTGNTLLLWLKNLAAICFLALNSMTANALLIDNGTYTTDTVSGLDWLHLDQTYGLAEADLESLSGWSLATSTQFCGLGTSFGISGCIFDSIVPGTSGYVDNSAAPDREERYNMWTSLRGVELPYVGGLSLVASSRVGLLSEAGVITDLQYKGFVFTEGDYLTYTTSVPQERPERMYYNQGYQDQWFMVRSVTVPEPSSLALLGLAITGLGFTRKQKTL